MVAVPAGGGGGRGRMGLVAVCGVRRARAARLAVLRYSLAELDAMDPTAFEYAVRDLMIRDGIDARHVGQRGDQAVSPQMRCRSARCGRTRLPPAVEKRRPGGSGAVPI